MGLYQGTPVKKPFMNGDPPIGAIGRKLRGFHRPGSPTLGAGGLRKTTTPDTGRTGPIRHNPVPTAPAGKGPSNLSGSEGRVTSNGGVTPERTLGGEGRTVLGPTPNEGTSNPVGLGKPPRHNIPPKFNKAPGGHLPPGGNRPGAPTAWKGGLAPATNSRPDLSSAIGRKLAEAAKPKANPVVKGQVKSK